MRQLILALILCAILLPLGTASAAPSAPLPVASIDEAIRSALGFDTGLCAGASQPAAQIIPKLGSHTYVLFVTTHEGENRFVLFVLEGDDTSPAWVGLVSPDGDLQLRETYTFGELKAKYPSPCDALYPTRA